MFLVLPCPNPPPAQPRGGWMWYGMEATQYKCPNGFGFSTGAFPYSFSNCTSAKVWDPPQADACVGKCKTYTNYFSHLFDILSARKCTGSPPVAWVGIDMDWPLSSQIMGTRISYTCPFMTKTNEEELSGNF
jgi:hypothetical protein